MTTIKTLAHQDGRAGSRGAWRSYSSAVTREVWHYSTLMLSFGLDAEGGWDGDLTALYVSTGHGSVSDQGGMNQLFRELGIPMYFSRKGGAEIVWTFTGYVLAGGHDFRQSIATENVCGVCGVHREFHIGRQHP